jgi:uncharacterized cupredoxin-like copper-binding protein
MRSQRRPGRLVVAGSLVVALGLAGAAAAWARPGGLAAADIEIPIHYSHYGLGEFTVPAGIPVRIVLRNDDPIDHEWIVGDAALHERHRTGTEPVHDTRPTEVTIPAGTTRETTVTFSMPGTYQYICHLPGHEAYGMVGTVVVTGR